MIIIALADIHSCLDYLVGSSGLSDDLSNADVVLIAGDITNFNGRDEAARILTELQKYNSSVLAVPGNCDLPAVDEYLRSSGVNLNCNCITVGEITFTGLGGSLACSRHVHNETSEEDFTVCLEHVSSMPPKDKKVVFVSHKPAKGTAVDSIGDGYHNGSEAIRKYIEQNQPMLAVSGHIHEAPGIDTIGKTTLVNPGPFRQGSYAYIELDETTVKAEIRNAGNRQNV